jgi:hypothetical protein
MWWRARARKLTFNCLLFLLGVFSCLLCLHLQISIRPSEEGPTLAEGTFYSSFSQVEPPCANKINKGRSIKGGGGQDGGNYYEEVFSEQVERRASPKRSSRSEPGRIINNSLGNSNSNYNETPGSSSVTVWVVTPTFYRPEQKPELTRVAQALLPVSSFVHWIVVDDISQGSEESLKDLKAFLEHLALTFTLLKSSPPSGSTKIVGKPRGVGGRQAAISWLRKNARDGIVYFADDDNTYDSEIFRQV